MNNQYEWSCCLLKERKPHKITFVFNNSLIDAIDEIGKKLNIIYLEPG